MSLIPFILDLADELHELGRCLANGMDIDDFGFGIYPGAEQPTSTTNLHQQQSPRRSRATPLYWLPSKRHHPYCRNTKTACCGGKANPEDINASSADKDLSAAASASINNSSASGKSAAYSVVNRNGFQVSMNVKQFSPNELTVKTIDNCIVVEGRHDDKEDGHGLISRHFVRKYMLPKGYDPNDVLSTLSSDGILTVRAPPPPNVKIAERQERIIEIQPFSGPAQLQASAKENTKEPAKKTSAASAISQPPEKKQKLDLSLQQQTETIQKQEQNNEIKKVAQPLNECNEQTEQERDEDVQQETPQKQHQSIGEKSCEKEIVVATESGKLEQNGKKSSHETLIAEPESQADSLLDSSTTAQVIPPNVSEIQEINLNTETSNTIVNDIAMTDNGVDNAAGNSTKTTTAEKIAGEDTNANSTNTMVVKNSITSTSTIAVLTLHSNDNGLVADMLPSVVSNSTEIAEAALDGDIDMETAETQVASAEVSVVDDVALLKAATSAVVTGSAATEPMDGIVVSEIAENEECVGLFGQTRLENGNNTATLATEEIAN
uniref:SHSP domain-containing protein n=1 Tax=Glossina morsitans morsitans TaxID=37546 RepID=A0A1B0G3A5_GLOMM